MTATVDSDYTDWCADLGVKVLDSLEVRQLPRDAQTPGEQERGVFCTEPVADKAILATVPFSALMSIETAHACDIIGPLLAGGTLSREDDALAALLCLERGKGESSKWSKHVAALPTVIHNVLYFEGLQLEALRGASLYVIGQQLQRQVEADYTEISAPVIAALSAAGHDGSALFSLERYRWALANIFSRFVSVARKGGTETLKCMVPFVDMFNHSPDSRVQHGFDDTADAFVVQTLQSWEPGTRGGEVFINYGELSSSRMLMLYGFVLDHELNPHDSVQLWAAMQPQAPDYAIKRQILQRNGVDDQIPFELGADGEPPQNLLACLRVQQLNDEELPRAQLAFDGDGGSERLSDRNEEQSLSLLSAALTSMLEAYATSGDADERLLAQWKAPSGASEAGAADSTVAADLPVPQFHERMAVALRYNEKRILQKHIARVAQMQKQLAGATSGGQGEDDAAAAAAAAATGDRSSAAAETQD